MPPKRPTLPAERGLLPGKRWLTYDDVGFALGFGRTRVYELIQRGELLAVGKGKATRITSESVRKYAEALEATAMKERRVNGGLEPPPSTEDDSRAKGGRG